MYDAMNRMHDVAGLRAKAAAIINREESDAEEAVNELVNIINDYSARVETESRAELRVKAYEIKQEICELYTDDLHDEACDACPLSGCCEESWSLKMQKAAFIWKEEHPYEKCAVRKLTNEEEGWVGVECSACGHTFSYQAEDADALGKYCEECGARFVGNIE